MRSEENHSLLRGLSECKSTMMSQGAQITTFKARIATLEAELLAARDSRSQRTAGAEPTQEQLDAFLVRANFTYGWRNLESQARWMAERAVLEINTLEAELLAARDLPATSLPADPRARLDLAETCGAVITGKPDGSEAVSVVFTPEAWRAFDARIANGVLAK